MYNFIFTKIWKREFDKLTNIDKSRIIKKLKFLKEKLDTSNALKPLNNFLPATHRLRIWNIRIILQKVDNDNFYILDIWYRGDIYK